VLRSKFVENPDGVPSARLLTGADAAAPLEAGRLRP